MKSQTSFTSAILASLAAIAGATTAGFKNFDAPPQFRGATPSRRSSKGIYGRGLTNNFNKKRREAMPKTGVLRDEHGVFTLIGARDPLNGNALTHDRRIWLGGISAQRGY